MTYNRIKKQLFLILFIFSLFFLPITVIAAGKITLGEMKTVGSENRAGAEENEQRESRVTIKPMISVSTRWDSNFYRSENSEEGIWTYLFQPGIELGYATAKSRISLIYFLNAVYYSGESDDYIGHSLSFSVRSNPLTRLELGVDDSYSRTRDTAQSDRFNNSVEGEIYSINRLTPALYYRFGERFSTRLRYQNTVTDYTREVSEDSVEHRGIFDLIYNFTETTSLDLEYQRWIRDYDLNTSDYTSNQLMLILRKQFKYLTFEAGGGYHTRSFNESGLDDMNTFSYRFAITGQNPPFPESRRSYITFAAEQNFNDAGSGDSYFKAHEFSLKGGRIFMDKVSADFELRYKMGDYETGNPPGRSDNIYSVSGGISYLYKEWLRFNTAVGYETRDSNYAEYNYNNIYFKIGVDSALDIAGPESGGLL